VQGKPYNIEFVRGVGVQDPFAVEPTYPEQTSIKRKHLSSRGYRTFSLGVYGNIEAQYRIGNLWLGLAPTIKYSLSPTSTKRDLSSFELPGEHLYSIGISLKAAYGF
jgi:hypothetical protein